MVLRHMVEGENNRLLVKLEGQNPAGSVKDRAAFYMIKGAEKRGEISPGDTLIEATSGNTGIALAMVATILGYQVILIMPDNMSLERRTNMTAYGAELILVTQEQGMEGARDLANQMHQEGKGFVLDQFSNPDNPLAHYQGTGPEIWNDTAGTITHFVSSMGTTGTITGASRFFKEKNSSIEIIGVQPGEDADIPGIRCWSKAYLPAIYDDTNIDRIIDVTQEDAERTMRLLATKEGLFCGVSSGGAVAIAIELSRQLKDSTIVSIVCDRGDRYISTGVFSA